MQLFAGGNVGKSLFNDAPQVSFEPYVNLAVCGTMQDACIGKRAIMAMLGPSTFNVMIAIGIVYIPAFARIVRGTTLELRVQDYVDAAVASGAVSSRILGRHILPGTLGPITVQVTLALATAILAEAALSFLGLGTQPPDPSWGSMLSFGREWIREAWWFSFFPGLAIFVTVLSLNVVGDGLRDAIDPRL